MNESHDEELVRSCLLGNKHSFAMLVEKYQKPIFNLALRMSGRRIDAEDITQTCFIKAFEKLHSYKPNYHFFSWLYRIAINESINWLRAHKRFTQLEDGMLPLDSDADRHTRQTELADTIQMALMQIKMEYRTVIILRHFQELSYEEIAAILNISVERVKSRLFTARNMLRHVLLKVGVKYEK